MHEANKGYCVIIQEQNICRSKYVSELAGSDAVVIYVSQFVFKTIVAIEKAVSARATVHDDAILNGRLGSVWP